MLELSDSRSRLVLLPESGGAIARFDAVVTGGVIPLLQPWDGTGKSGCQLLVPWSNRISGGGFEYDGRFYPIEPNVPNEAFPIHGDGFQKRWRLAGQTDTGAELVLDNGAIGPYRCSRIQWPLRVEVV